MMPALLISVPSRDTTFWRCDEWKAISLACFVVSVMMVVLRERGEMKSQLNIAYEEEKTGALQLCIPHSETGHSLGASALANPSCTHGGQP